LYRSRGTRSKVERLPKKDPPMPVGPNPAASRPLHVAPFGKAWAVVEGLGVIFCSSVQAECEAELERQIQRRRQSPSNSQGESS
jgi:hypothetical protein